MDVFTTVIGVIALILTAGAGIGGIALISAHRMNSTMTDHEKGENENVHISD